MGKKNKKKLPKYPFGGDIGKLMGNIFGGNFDPTAFANATSGDPTEDYSQFSNLTEPKFNYDGKKYNIFGGKKKRYKNALKDYDEELGQWQEGRENSAGQVEMFSQLMPLFNQFQEFMQDKDTPTFNPNNYSVSGNVEGFEEGGEVDADMQEEAHVPVQTELGELAVLPDLKIVKVNAKKKHKNMKDSKVTDILPSGTFVASNNERMAVTKKEAEKLSFGYEAGEYEEGKAGKIPNEQTLSDIMNKNKMTPAQILKQVEKKYKTSSRDGDAFTDLANAENLTSRLPYVESLKFLYDAKKPKKKTTPANMMFGGNVTNSGGKNPLQNDKKKYFIPNVSVNTEEEQVPKAGWGAAIGGLLQGIMGMIEGSNQRKRAAQLHEENKIAIDEATKEQRGYLGLGTGMGALGILGQDATVTAPQYDTRYVDNMVQEVPQSAVDFARSSISRQNRGVNRSLLENTSNYGQAAANMSLGNANAINSMSELAYSNAMQNIGLRNNFLQQRGELSNSQIEADTNALNQTRGNRNAQISGLGDIGTNYFTGLGRVSANKANMLLSSAGASFNALQGANSNIWQGGRTATIGAGDAFDEFMKERKARLDKEKESTLR